MAEINEKMEHEVAKVFRNLRETEVEAPPYLETRVLARLEERKRDRNKFVFWRWATAGASAFSALLAVFLFVQNSRSDFYAFVQKPFVVRVSVAELGDSKIARAEISLPDGVYFDIEEYPELRTRKTLSLKWNEQMGTELVPFILNSTEQGTKTVTVRFFSADGSLLQEKKIVVDLKEHT